MCIWVCSHQANFRSPINDPFPVSIPNFSINMWTFLCFHHLWNTSSLPLYKVGINYRRISLPPVTRPDSVWFLPVGFRHGQCLRPTTSKDTTRIATAHQHHNRERHTRHPWEDLAGMGVSPGHLPCHTWNAHRMHLTSLWNCKHSSFKC